MVEKGGFGGTEVAFMEIGKYLCEQACFMVDLVGFSHESYRDNSSGINFISEKDFCLESINDYDWYCPLFHVYDEYHYKLLSHITNPRRTKVVFWFHCFINDEILLAHKQKGYDIYGIGVSSWVTNHYKNPLIFHPNHVWTVPNAVSPDFFERFPVNNIVSNKIRGSWSFHATYDRGCAMAYRVFQRVSKTFPMAAQTMHVMSYYTPDAMYPSPSFVKRYGSLSKYQVADFLATTEYFVYPLVTPQNHVHHDTFACVILEALALGVIVITWGVACIPYVYGDYVVSIPPPQWYSKDARFSGHPWFASEEAVDILCGEVVKLEINPERKNSIRKRGMEWARQQTWDKSGQIMASKLKELC